MTVSPGAAAPFWFPDSVLLCALLLSRPAIWWVYILAPLPLRLLVAVTPDLPLGFLLATFGNDSLKGLVTAILMRRVFQGRGIKFNVLRDFWLYLIITSLIGPALSGVFGAAGWYALGREFWPTWRSWFLGDAIANLVLTPVLLYLAQYWRRLVGAKPVRYAEALILFSALPITAHEAYKQGIGVAGLIDPLGYLPLALLVWAAIRFGPAGASGALSVVSILAIAGIGASGSALSSEVMDRTLSLQLFMIVLSIPIMSLAVLVEQLVNTEQSLRESQRRLVSIYNTVEDVIFHLAVEPEGQFRILSVNAAFLRLTGLNQEEVVGKTANEVIPEPSRSMVLKKYRQAIEEKTLVRWEETSDYPAGRLTGEVSVAPVIDRTGTCSHLVGSIHDITGIKRAEQIENQLGADLAASRDEIRALAASLMRAQEDERRRVSRELHDQICQQLALLAVDIGRLTVSPPPFPENAKSQLEAIQARLVQTSQETREIAHEMHTAILDDLGLVPSLKDLCSQFSERYPNISWAFEARSLPDVIPPEVATCLYRVAQEGLQNKAKHSHAKFVSVRLGVNKGAVVLTIQDDGVGFDPKAVRSRGELGLISMRERAHLVNGKLTITSQLGHGTQLVLVVPLPVQQPMKRPRVLLADDHPQVLEDIRALLAPNYEIVGTVADGRSLVEAALRLKPDLIVADITMPQLNGIEAAVQIKKSLPGMKLLFVTMHASTAYVKATFEAGGTGYVLKSGIREDLLEAVEIVLGGRIYVSPSLSKEYPEQLQDAVRTGRS